MPGIVAPPLHACGPMRGDNFVRFVVSDGLGVAHAAEQARAAEAETEAAEARH